MRGLQLIGVLLGTLAAAGCETVLDPGPRAGSGAAVIAMALTEPVAVLEAGSATNPSRAMALSLLYRHGLRDLPVDPDRADALRALAARASGPVTITQYTAGLNGAPGRVNLLQVPGVGPSGAVLAAAELCARVLEGEPGAIEIIDGFDQVPAAAMAACGGDAGWYRLAQPWEEARSWGPQPLPNCPEEDARCAVLARKIGRLNARDPGGEARAAAARGDFRLGALNHIGPAPQGWRLPGVNCRAWTRDQIGAWHVNQDVIMNGDGEHSRAAIGFIAAYNRAMVGHPAFPHADVCAAGLGAPSGAYAGPVVSWPEYARAGDAGAEPPAGRPIDETDVFGRTAFEWAAERDDAPMMMRLLAAGADPNQVADGRDPTPLARALQRGRLDLAEALLARGAKMEGETRLCDAPMHAFIGDPGPSGICTWVGLLLERGRPEWIERAVADGGGFGLWEAYFGAVEAGDEATARRLAPLMGGPGAAGALQKTWKLGRSDLALAMVASGAHAVARSPTEERLWKAAADAGQTEALAFLYQYGGDLNLLATGRVAACETAAMRGATDVLLACVTEAGTRRRELTALLEVGDAAEFGRALGTAADVAEDAKPTLLEQAVERADAGTVASLLARGAKTHRSRAFTDGGDPAPATPYDGALRAAADAQAEASGYVAAMTPTRSDTPVALALRRGDREILRLLVDAGAPGLAWAALHQGGLSDSLDLDTMEESRDVSALADAPGPEQMAALRLAVPELARSEDGSAALEEVFSHAVAFGYDEVMRLVVDAGFDPRQAARPDVIWQRWAGLGHPCKPSTGRLLVRYGVDARYPLDPRRNGWRPQRIVASGCRNPDSAAVLVEAGLAPINELDEHGRTVLDQALDRHYRPQMQAALKALGGRPGVEVDPEGHARRLSVEREGGDLDLEQSERE